MSSVIHVPSPLDSRVFAQASITRSKAELIREMKRKWDEINKEYQLLTLSLFNLDTVNKVTRKEYCEEKMAKLEKEIDRLSKGHVYVEADMELVPPGTAHGATR